MPTAIELFAFTNNDKIVSMIKEGEVVLGYIIDIRDLVSYALISGYFKQPILALGSIMVLGMFTTF